MNMRSGMTAIAIAGMLAACDNGNGPTGPTSPNPTPADLFRGTTGLTITAPTENACSQKTPAWGFAPPTVLAQGTITREGSGWIFRVDSRFGNFQITMASTGMTQTEMIVNGTAQGSATDMLSLLRFQNPDRVAVTNAAMEGTYSTQLRGVNGRITSGTLAFSDNQGGVTTCTESLLFLFLLDR
jgi:hypothetical protein